MPCSLQILLLLLLVKEKLEHLERRIELKSNNNRNYWWRLCISDMQRWINIQDLQVMCGLHIFYRCGVEIAQDQTPALNVQYLRKKIPECKLVALVSG